MQIDWVTVAAQIVNFLILVWLLKRFLYRPITNAIAARESQIAARVADAEQAKADAVGRATAYDEKLAELERQKEGFLARAQEEAHRTRQDLEQAARRDVDNLGREWRQRLEAEQARYLAELRGRAALSIVNLARKALSDLAEETLEAQMLRQFEKRVRDCAPALQEAVRVRDGDTPEGTVSTRFALSDTQRDAVRRVLAETAGSDIALAFRDDDADTAGIALTVGGLRIAWTVDSYLDALEADIGGYLKSRPDTRHGD